ncbi:hypothetical protein FHS21_006330 [Phyllobacterium trifolii]|uniref:Sel1 repeat family protein n=1 Tax=Phyllobacterium trifolii TaxID=300193 RepID=A0A839UJE2_9HYPH|nr:SEL1-like repeat protein [Phyllobacterium trifolii]MBB3149873.1 hypothetical protein [Phyllobacterium trifolii]
MSNAVAEGEKGKRAKSSVLIRNIMFLTFAALLLILGVFVVRIVFPSQLEREGAALVAKNYSEAMSLLLPLAGEGVAGAELGVGYIYANGLGVQKDNMSAVGFYRRAAEQGLAAAPQLRGCGKVSLTLALCTNWGKR